MIYVDIEKNFGKFNLRTKFEFDNEIMGLWERQEVEKVLL